MTHHLTPDDLRALDYDALANLRSWRADEVRRLRAELSAAVDALAAAAAEGDRRASERNREAFEAAMLARHRQFHAHCDANGIVPQCDDCPLETPEEGNA